MILRRYAATLALAASGFASAAYAQDAPPVINSGDTGWVLSATALVLLMTLPGLGLFYGGLVRSKNFLSVLLQCGAIAALVSVLWIAVGYTLAFGDAARRDYRQRARLDVPGIQGCASGNRTV